jgi:hypothetical protein
LKDDYLNDLADEDEDDDGDGDSNDPYDFGSCEHTFGQ